MIDKSIFIVYPQQSPSKKYPTLKKSPELTKDIAFRLNFSSTKGQERNINHVMGTFEKPFTTLGVSSELKNQFTQIIIDLKATFKKINKDHSNKELNQKFWEQWNQFDTILHQMSVHSAYYYCSREIERLTLDITGAIKSIKSNPPAVPGIQHEFTVTVEKIQKSFVQIVDRFAEIVDSKVDESKKIRDLESMRNQIRQFRTDIVGDRSKFFSLSSASHAAQEKAKQTIESSLNTIIATISDLKRQTYLLDNLDNEITQAMRVIEMMIDGDPLPNAKSERIQEKVKIEKENLVENRSVSSPSKVKVNLSRRCTISSNKDDKKKRRSSRRRKSIKRNQSLIELEKSNSENESDASFCSTLSEFQDGKELLFDSSPIKADLSDIDEDTMFQISDDDCENSDIGIENDNEIEYDIPFECIRPIKNVSDEKDCEINPKENNSSRNINLEIENPLDDDDSIRLSTNSDSTDIESISNVIDSNGISPILDHLEEEVIEKDNIIENCISDKVENTTDQVNNEIQICDNNDEINGNDTDKSDNIIDDHQFEYEKLEEEPNNNEISDLTNKDVNDDLQNNDIKKDSQIEEPQILILNTKGDESKELISKNDNQKEYVTSRKSRSHSTRRVSLMINCKSEFSTRKVSKNKDNDKLIPPNSLLPTSDDSCADEFLSSDLEEISIPLVCSCPLLTLDQWSYNSQLSTSELVSFEKAETNFSIIEKTNVNLPIIEKKKSNSNSCYMMFLLICFMSITFLLLFILNVQ